MSRKPEKIGILIFTSERTKPVQKSENQFDNRVAHAIISNLCI